MLLIQIIVHLQRGAFVSEPAILVKYNEETSQVWSMEKLDLKLIDMRELYESLGEKKAREMIGVNYADPFSENTENHSLIGVANVFLSVLFHDVNLDYHTPIISQQGEVAGRLQVQIQRVAGTFAQDHNSDCSDGSKSDDENPVMTVQVSAFFKYPAPSFRAPASISTPFRIVRTNALNFLNAFE